jgi:hypothetical protein
MKRTGEEIEERPAKRRVTSNEQAIGMIMDSVPDEVWSVILSFCSRREVGTETNAY